MTGVGLLLILLGVAIQAATPLRRLAVITSQHHTIAIGALLQAAHPLASRSPSLERLVAEADAALLHDPMIHAIGQIAATYARAAGR